MEQKILEFLKAHKIPVIIAVCLLIAVIPAITLVQSFRASEEAWLYAETAAKESVQDTIVVITQTTTIAATTTTTAVTTTTTMTTTTEPPPPPDEILLEDVPYYTQHGLLPTGCELVSAKMLLEYYTEEPVDIQDIIDRVDCQYPKSVDGVACAPHPSEAFIGSPWDPTSFGCFSPIICDMMNDLLPDEYMAVDTTGKELQELAETYLPQNKPVLVWATISMVRSFPHMGWYLSDEHCQPTDEWYDWLANEHCLVLIGYDEDYYYFNDPYAWNACTKYRRDIVETRFEEMDRYSAVVVERPEYIKTPETYVMTRVSETTTTTTTTVTTAVTTATVPATSTRSYTMMSDSYQ